MSDLPGLLIDGPLRTGDGEADQVNDPSDGSDIVALAAASRAQVDEAVDCADRAFPIWSGFSPKERLLALLRIADRIESLGDEFAALEMRNLCISRQRITTGLVLLRHNGLESNRR